MLYSSHGVQKLNYGYISRFIGLMSLGFCGPLHEEYLEQRQRQKGEALKPDKTTQRYNTKQKKKKLKFNIIFNQNERRILLAFQPPTMPYPAQAP